MDKKTVILDQKLKDLLSLNQNASINFDEDNITLKNCENLLSLEHEIAKTFLSLRPQNILISGVLKIKKKFESPDILYLTHNDQKHEIYPLSQINKYQHIPINLILHLQKNDRLTIFLNTASIILKNSTLSIYPLPNQNQISTFSSSSKTKLSLDQQTIIINEANTLIFQNYHNQHSFEIYQDRLIFQEQKIHSISVQLELNTDNNAIVNFYFNLILNNQQHKAYIVTILPGTKYFIFKVKDEFLFNEKDVLQFSIMADGNDKIDNGFYVNDGSYILLK